MGCVERWLDNGWRVRYDTMNDIGRACRLRSFVPSSAIDEWSVATVQEVKHVEDQIMDVPFVMQRACRPMGGSFFVII